MPERWPPYLIERACQPPPSGCCVVAGTTPVVSFGDPLRPRVATLGINPSSGEFLAADGSMLAGGSRRLATHASLGVDGYEAMSAEHGAKVVDDCAAYFERRPYRWFTPLDRILRSALGVSYFERTACHLDLVQWATDPLWGQLDEVVRARLLAADRSFLISQLASEHYRAVVVNGRTAMQWVELAGLVHWRELDRLAGPPAAGVYLGDTAVPCFVGWSCNLQSQAGAPRHTPRLVEFLRSHGGSALDQEPEPVALGSALPRGAHAGSVAELVGILAGWLDSGEATIGDVSRFPRAPWISVESPHGVFDLNADTRRDAVAAFVAHAETHGPSLGVVANNRGRMNKVVFEDAPTPGFYAYLRHPL